VSSSESVTLHFLVLEVHDGSFEAIVKRFVGKSGGFGAFGLQTGNKG
jgi:hypothetical protein